MWLEWEEFMLEEEPEVGVYSGDCCGVICKK